MPNRLGIVKMPAAAAYIMTILAKLPLLGTDNNNLTLTPAIQFLQIDPFTTGLWLAVWLVSSDGPYTDNICDNLSSYFYRAVMPQCPSVCPSVTFRSPGDHIGRNTSKIISPPHRIVIRL